jgi:PAS domain S-box-containing protein
MVSVKRRWLGRSAALLRPPERTHEERKILTRVKAGALDVFEAVRVRKDGTSISVSLRIAPIRSQRGEIIGASHLARPTTERTLREAAVAHI